MRRFKLALVALLLPFLAGCATEPASVPPISDPQDVIEADRQRAAAMVNPDAAVLDEVFHDGLTYSHSNGRVENKPELIERLVTGTLNYQVLQSTNPAVWIEGTTAIVTGPTTFKVASDVRSLDLAVVYTAVYVHDGDRWRLVAYHSSPKSRGVALS